MSKRNLKSIITKALAATLIITSINCGSVPVEAAKGKVTGISVTNLPASTLTLKKGKSKVLKVKVKTSGKGASKKYTVKSSKPKTVAVSKSGKNIKVKALKKGKAVITLTTKSGKKKAKVKVTVGTPASKMTISKTKATVSKNKTLALTAKITTKKVSNKKILWKSSNPKVATVDAKGVVKGITAGKATITALAADGSGVKKQCEVTVNNNVYIDSVVVKDHQSIYVTLSQAYKLPNDNFIVKTKRYETGNFLYKCSINNITTTDNRTYAITLSEYLDNAQLVQVTITGIPNGSDTKTARYMENNCPYFVEDIIETNVNSEIYERYYADCYGEATIESVSGLPKGLTVAKAVTYDVRLDVKGKCTQPGRYDCVIKLKDELNYTYTYKLTFLVGSEKKIAAGAYSVNGVKGDYDYSVWVSIHAVGGSGSYHCSIVGDTHDLYTYGGQSLRGYLSKPGKFNVTIKVEDKNDPSLYTIFTLPIEIKQGYTVSGIVKDLSGKQVLGCDIVLINVNYCDNFLAYVSYQTADSGEYKFTGIPAGKYNVRVEKENCIKTYHDVTISKDKKDFTLILPAYSINLVSSDSSILFDDFKWYSEKGFEYGSGSTLYLTKGKHILTARQDVGLYSCSVEATVNVEKSQTFTVNVIKKSTVMGELKLSESQSVSANNSYVHYSFTPTESGTYKFYSRGNYIVIGRLLSASGTVLKNAEFSGDNINIEMTYELTAGETYYLGVKRDTTSEEYRTFYINVSKNN
ncbi:MAG: hypothetical protein E7254_06475 [Lachnospiraceae bacterium]|nr:hypothetical protein [Lachnospiraceae bacterium]